MRIPWAPTLIVRNLATGRDIALGNASEYVWQDFRLKGHLLAFAIASPDKTGNGIQVFDTATGTLRVLDSSNANYSGLAWRKDGADLAALRSKADEKYEGRESDRCWPGITSAKPTSAHTSSTPVPERNSERGCGLCAYRKPSWSADGSDVFFGIAKWYEKPPQGQRTRRRMGQRQCRIKRRGGAGHPSMSGTGRTPRCCPNKRRASNSNATAIC